MAVIQNFWLKGAKKKLAGSVIYKAGGQTIQRSLAESVSNPRTRSQMIQRVRWANMVNFYRANRDWMKYAYESKKASQSDYNKLMSLNVANNRIYLTKQAAAAGACVVDQYIMTQGSLPSITYNFVDGDIKTNIFLDPEIEVNEGSTVATFSRAIINANPGVKEGDQLSLIRYTQMVNEQTGYPYVIVRKYEIVLSLDSVELWANFWPASLVNVYETTTEKYLYIGNTGNAGGLLMVLSRTISGKTYVSTQSILPVNNEGTIAAWSSDSALNRAINSYGESADAFLSTDSAAYAESEPIQATILYANLVGQIVNPNRYLGKLSELNGFNLQLVFNKDFNETIQHLYVDTTQTTSGTIEQPTPAVSGPNVAWSLAKGDIGADAIIRAVRVVTSQNTYRIDFGTIPPSDGGLE